MIRKINIEEYEKVIEFINKQFDIDFKKAQPSIYNITNNYQYHYVYEENGEILGVFLAKPLIYKNVKFLGIGSLCVREDKRNCSIMRKMFEYINCYLEKDYDISFLLGDKKRYENFGYYKVGTTGIIKIKNKYLTTSNEVNLKIINENSDDIFNVIKEYSLIKRKKEEIYQIFKGKGNDIFLLTEGEKKTIVIYNPKNNEIVDIIGNIEQEKVIKRIINHINKEYIKLIIDLGSIKNVNYLSDRYEFSNHISFKIINYKNVIKQLFNYNSKKYGELLIRLEYKTIKLNYSQKGLDIFEIDEKNNIYLKENEIHNILFSGINFIDLKLDMNLVTSWFPLSIPSTIINIDGV